MRSTLAFHHCAERMLEYAAELSLQTSIASLQANIESLRATVKTVGWGIGVIGMLAIVFFTAGKSLHWF